METDSQNLRQLSDHLSPTSDPFRAKYAKYMKEKPKLDVDKIIMAPMPGTVKSVSVEVDQIIGEGTECCVLEAMKMQNSLKIGATGKIKSVHVKPGDTVQADQVLVELE